MTDTYDIGDQVTLQATFRNLAGALTNPTATTLKYKDPAGNVTTVNDGDLTTASTGIKTYAVVVDEAGQWWYRFSGSGAVVAAEEGSFTVRPQQVI